MNLDFEITFKSQKGNNWPSVNVFYNDLLITTNKVDDINNVVKFTLQQSKTNDNSLIINYFNKTESETIVKDGKIVTDQSLEIVKIHCDQILIEPWLLTDNYYYPVYFDGYLQHVNDPPVELKSQLVWHFPGKFIIKNLPHHENFWQWYQEQRTIRILENLIDPSGQIRNNHRGLTDEDKKLITEIKELLHV